MCLWVFVSGLDIGPQPPLKVDIELPGQLTKLGKYKTTILKWWEGPGWVLTAKERRALCIRRIGLAGFSPSSCFPVSSLPTSQRRGFGWKDIHQFIGRSTYCYYANKHIHSLFKEIKEMVSAEFCGTFFLFFYFAILYERNLSKIRWIRTWKCRFLFKFEARLANFNLYGLSGVISFQKTFRLGVYISGGTLLWNNRRLIGRSLIVLARKVQNNRD